MYKKISRRTAKVLIFYNVSIRFSNSILKDLQYLASLKNLTVLLALRTVIAALFINIS